VGDDASLAGVWQLQPVAGKFWIKPAPRPLRQFFDKRGFPMWRSWNTMRRWGITTAHECGHVIQHKQACTLLHWRMASVGPTTFASQIVLWLPLLGMFTGFINTGVALTFVASALGHLNAF
jgi:putative neutral zinc metallopeptidase